MIIPIGHEKFTVRRLPWVTFSIMFICIVVHINVNNQVQKNRMEIYRLHNEINDYYFTHPYLELKEEVQQYFMPDPSAEDLFAMLSEQYSLYEKEIDEAQIEKEQAELDKLSASLLETIDDDPYRRWGFVPNKFSIIKLFTYMFMHGGVIHLLGNLFILYLAGPFIEDKWGRPIYLGFYLFAGLFSGFMFFAHYPHSTVPLIGASGAIAGAMGVFLIRFWKVRIKFFYWFLMIVYGTFKAPAWIVLPFWFANQVFNAKVMDTLFGNMEGGGVAYWAHVWGFVVGVFFAWIMKIFEIEEKYINPKIEQQITLVDNTIIEEAMELKEQGKKNEAFYLLRDAARKNPSNQDVIEALWGMALELEKTKDAAPLVARLIKTEIQQNDADAALLHWTQLKINEPDYKISLNIKIMIMEKLIDAGRDEEAEDLMEEVFSQISDAMPIGNLIKMAKISLKMSLDTATKVVHRVMENPQLPPEKREDFQQALDNLKAEYKEDNYSPRLMQKQVPTSGFQELKIGKDQYVPAEAKSRSINKKLNVLSSIPLGIKQGKIFLKIEKLGQKGVLLSKVKIISVVRIKPNGAKSYLLIDLIMNELKGEDEIIRILRLSSTQFNPQKLVPKAANPLNAFRIFIAALVKISSAQSYPTAESVQCKKFVDFPSVEEYEKKLLE